MQTVNKNTERSAVSSRHIKIFDTTLRDGQQCPGAGMTFGQNLEYFRLASLLRVDVLEAGFPSASGLDFDIVRAICDEAQSAPYTPIIAALCQLREEQIERTIESLQPLIKIKKARLHTYVPVDPELMPASLGRKASDHGQIIKDLSAFVSMAVKAGLEVEFSPEGYSRMHDHFDFVTELIRAAVEAGATVINCPDTIGGACAFEGPNYFVEKMNRHAAIIHKEYPGREITWSVHCHNDFGLAVANSINGVFNGPARQIEGCINGIGERAGNASLEQCIMLIKQFGAAGEQKSPEEAPFYTTINTEYIQEISDFVADHMLPRQPHSPVSGDNAARHSSGGHTNAILKNPLAYQPYDPKEIGKEITFMFGPLSGGNHAKSIIEGFGYVCSEEEKATVAQVIKETYSERRKGITDDELIQAYFDYRKPIKVDSIDYSKEKHQSSVSMSGTIFEESGDFRETHDGKDSALAAVKKMIESRFGPYRILNHRSQSDTVGIDANSISEIIVETEDRQQFIGKGRDQDIEISAIKALIDAVNFAYIERNFRLQPSAKSTDNSAKGTAKPVLAPS
jgi:2-isopropylmalate synthase